MSSDEPDTVITDVNRAPPLALAANDCLVVIHRREGPLGKVYALSHTPLRIGRDPDNDIVLDDVGVSRRHARLERRDGVLLLQDVGSRNGTLVNDQELGGSVALTNKDLLKFGSVILKYLMGSDVEAALHEQIYQNTIKDNLTGLSNRFHLDQELEREFVRSHRHGRALSLLVIDVDFFKRVNDEYGHHVGDVVLRAVADVIRGSVRSGDVVARYGGEELVVLLPETELRQAVSVAEKLRQSIEARKVHYRDVTARVTVSVGCAELRDRDSSPEDFFARCDASVYTAKQAGRNCVRTAE
jgi:two-component system cell cycle response regulator